MRNQFIALGRLLALVLAPTAESRADCWPSFYLERCAWEATDIIVAHQQGHEQAVATTDEVTVLEAWKGNLAAGTVLRGIELPAMPIKVGGKPGDLVFGQRNDAPAPKTVSGERLVLFLKHPSAKEGRPAGPEWVGAGEGFGDDVEYSVVWLDEDIAYAMFRGLLPLRTGSSDGTVSEAGLKQATLDILTAKGALENAQAIADLPKRVAALQPMVGGACWRARHEAITALGQCGPAAVPALEKRLKRYEDNFYLSDLTRALADASRDQAGPAMVGLLKDELAYWKRTAPTRASDHFWDIGGTHLAHHRILQTALGIVKQSHYLPARDVVRELRDFWTTLPRFDSELDKKAIQQIADQCEETLLALEGGVGPSNGE